VAVLSPTGKEGGEEGSDDEDDDGGDSSSSRAFRRLDDFGKHLVFTFARMTATRRAAAGIRSNRDAAHALEKETASLGWEAWLQERQQETEEEADAGTGAAAAATGTVQPRSGSEEGEENGEEEQEQKQKRQWLPALVPVLWRVQRQRGIWRGRRRRFLGGRRPGRRACQHQYRS